jgi:hypothetical protein
MPARTSRDPLRNATAPSVRASPPADPDGVAGEIRRGTIRHRYSALSKGIQMLRLERELAPILDAWRAAVKQDPKAWPTNAPTNC